ncbi:MAG: hypothetical protein E7112_05120 [Bacteroidales bacterium]|nr:hypothetical protein [Bacteroidales bacterium]
MKKTLIAISAVCLTLASCAPMKHAVHVEMRHPSRSGVDLAGKDISVVYLETDNTVANTFSEGMADGFAYTLEQDYGTGEGSVGIYRMRMSENGNYASRDSLFNILMDTGADVVFLFDTVRLGTIVIGGATRVASPSSQDSSYVSRATMPYTMKLFCFDAMDQKEEVKAFGGTSVARPDIYSDGKRTSGELMKTAMKNIDADGWNAGVLVADSFKSQWKHEQYSIVYYETEKWYDALVKAEQYDWKGAMEIWLGLLDTGDLMKRACAEFNISVACYMLGDYHLASEWLDRSDEDNKLPISDAMRKRIDQRMR